MENATNKCQWLHTFKGSWCTVLGKGLGAGYVASVMRGRIARFCLVLTLRGGGGGRRHRGGAQNGGSPPHSCPCSAYHVRDVYILAYELVTTHYPNGIVCERMLPQH